MILRLTICACLALAAASGDVLQYQVDFTSDTLHSCFATCLPQPDPFPVGLPDAWIGTFQLDSTDLATDGSYDVTSSFRSSKTFTDPFPFFNLATTGSVDAVVSGGVVTGLSADYSISYDILPDNGAINYRAKLVVTGSFFRLDTTGTFGGGTPNVEAEDGYSLGAPTAVPEPASLGSALALTALVGGLKRRRSRSQTR